MSRSINRSRDAQVDLIDIAYYLGEGSDDDTPFRFLDAVEETYRQLAEMPGIGVRRDYGNPKNAGMRMFPVMGFPKYLIFYRYDEDTLEVLRVIHGARDLQAIFGPEDED